ncbi:MAG: type IX secretion system sortase PorU [Cyclobacteriaceae bacterium]|nr:type IX secretion system sortase PorU [Cyclobacteriaceae bacterium HetDA_MAG_MS6]
MARLSITVVLIRLACFDSQAQSSLFATGDVYQIEIPKSGIYKISYTDLRKLGLDPSNFLNGHFHVYGSGGGPLSQSNSTFQSPPLKEISIFQSFSTSGSFGKKDYILFYAEGPEQIVFDSVNRAFECIKNIYSASSFYYLKLSSVKPMLIQEKEIHSIQQEILDTHLAFEHVEMDETNLLSSGRDWFGPAQTSTLDLAVPLAGKTNSRTFISARFLSRANTKTAYNVIVNDSLIEQQRVAATTTNPYGIKGVLEDYSNKLEVEEEHLNLKFEFEGEEWFGHLDKVFINYERKSSYRGRQQTMRFRSMKSQKHFFSVEERKSGLLCWDVSTPDNPVSLRSVTFDGNYYYQSSGSDIDLHIFKLKDVYRPKAMTMVKTQNLGVLPSPELLIITPEVFSGQAKRLEQHREANDQLAVEVVTVESIYHEFSSGRQDISAIRNFIRSLYQKGTSLRYVLLFGDASYDYLDRDPANSNFVPTYESVNSYHNIHSYSSDDFYGFMEDDEGEWIEGNRPQKHDLDIAIGRLPVSSTEEAKIMVDKLIKYDTTTGEWQKRMLFIADNGDENKHQLQSQFLSDKVEKLLPEMAISRVWIDEHQAPENAEVRGNKARQLLNDFVNNGGLLVDFIGHGAETAWTNDRILDLAMVSRWENDGKYPVFVTATCEFGRYDDWARKSGAEVALLNPTGGAIALLTTTRPVFFNTNFIVSDAFHESLTSRASDEVIRLGDIHVETKNNSIEGTINRNFTLLGDPSMQLKLPWAKQIKVDEIRSLITHKLDTIGMMDILQVEGKVNDPEFEGEIVLTLYDHPENRQTKGESVGSLPMTFQSQERILSRGIGHVAKGSFSIQFTTPNSFSNQQIGKPKIDLYATDERQEFFDVYQDFVLQMQPVSNQPDTTPPTITGFLNTADFRNGDPTDRSAIVFADIEDDSGLDLTQLWATLNRQVNINLASQYQPTGSKSGKLQYLLTDLSPGEYEIEVHAADLAGNHSTMQYLFFVTDSVEYWSANTVALYPNPVDDLLTYEFNKRHGELVFLTFHLFDFAGKEVYSFEQQIGEETEIPYISTIDLRDLLPGQYIYSIRLQTPSTSNRHTGRILKR